jgi:NAD+ synthase (glutamine-hydrolysing)
MRVAIAQIDTTVGAFDQNLDQIRRAAREAERAGAELVLFPEQTLPGYPARDFLELPEFVARNVAALETLKAESGDAALCIGWASPHGGVGAGLHNAVSVLRNGRILATGHKLLLPNYDVFDEARYFDPGDRVAVVEVGGVTVGLTICEDIWNDKQFWPRRRYERDPVEEAVARGAQLVVNVSASPYAVGKPRLRERMLGAAASRHGVPIVFCNLVGGNDSLVFDGQSLAIGADGAVLARGPAFEERVLVVDVEPTRRPSPGAPGRPHVPASAATVEPSEADLEELLAALVTGVRSYATKVGFRGAVLGLSGGIDSALTAVIAARALGPEAVLGVAMPSRFTEAISNDDAAGLARNLGIEYRVIPIERMFAAALETLAPAFAGRAPDVTEENLQARTRGLILMGLSNKLGKLLLTTGNKSELGVGYCTLYGDMAGGLAVIGDLPKTLVWALSRHVNRSGEVIPWRTIERPPTAELRANQTDQDSLPPYEVLDRILHAHVVERLPVEAIVARGEDEATVRRVLSLVLKSEYKRRQAAPTLRVTSRAFGEGWRFPIAHGYRY